MNGTVPNDLHCGRGQVPLRHALRICLGQTLTSRVAHYNVLMWGIGMGILNGFVGADESGWDVMIASMLIAAGIGYTAMVPWRWRILKRGTSFRKILLVNGAVAFVCGALVFYLSLWTGVILYRGVQMLWEAAFLHFVFAGVSLAGFIYVLVGYYSVSGMDVERHNRRIDRQRRRLQQLADEAQVVALRAQINPHFFFNALNTIAALIPESPADAERAVELMATALRPVLTGDQPMTVPLEAEIRVAKAYAEIEKLRMGDRLQMTFNVDETLSAVHVPGLSLQPLVENAVRHGISQTSDAMQVQLTARREQQAVLIEVVNFPDGSRRPEWHELVAVHSENGHALSNLNARARILFGGSAHVTTRVSPDRLSAVARMEIPGNSPTQSRNPHEVTS